MEKDTVRHYSKKIYFLDNDFVNSSENQQEKFQFLLRIGKCLQDLPGLYHTISVLAQKFSRKTCSINLSSSKCGY